MTPNGHDRRRTNTHWATWVMRDAHAIARQSIGTITIQRAIQEARLQNTRGGGGALSPWRTLAPLIFVSGILACLAQANIQAYELYWAQGGTTEPTRLSLLQDVPLTSGGTTTITFEMIDSQPSRFYPLLFVGKGFPFKPSD